MSSLFLSLSGSEIYTSTKVLIAYLKATVLPKAHRDYHKNNIYCLIVLQAHLCLPAWAVQLALSKTGLIEVLKARETKFSSDYVAECDLRTGNLGTDRVQRNLCSGLDFSQPHGLTCSALWTVRTVDCLFLCLRVLHF